MERSLTCATKKTPTSKLIQSVWKTPWVQLFLIFTQHILKTNYLKQKRNHNSTQVMLRYFYFDKKGRIYKSKINCREKIHTKMYKHMVNKNIPFLNVDIGLKSNVFKTYPYKKNSSVLTASDKK